MSNCQLIDYLIERTAKQTQSLVKHIGEQNTILVNKLVSQNEALIEVLRVCSETYLQ